MSEALDPSEIFKKAAREGRRRLDQSLLELVATGFIAGFTIIFGMIALAVLEGMTRPLLGEAAKIVGGLGFGLGVVYLIVGRAELFSENFFDPIAAAFEPGEHAITAKIARLWTLTFLLNLAGGAVLILVLSVEGALPTGAPETFVRIAEETAERPWDATLMRAVIGGALVALLSFLVAASRGTTSRVMLSFSIGFLLALGPFDHVIVSLLHLGLGFGVGANLTWAHILEVALIATAGNLIGGVGLVTLSHAAQAKAAQKYS